MLGNRYTEEEKLLLRSGKSLDELCQLIPGHSRDGIKKARDSHRNFSGVTGEVEYNPPTSLVEALGGDEYYLVMGR